MLSYFLHSQLRSGSENMAVETSTGELPLAGAPPESTAWQKDMETDDHQHVLDGNLAEAPLRRCPEEQASRSFVRERRSARSPEAKKPQESKSNTNTLHLSIATSTSCAKESLLRSLLAADQVHVLRVIILHLPTGVVA